jgi:hypothetical protein
VYNYPGRGLLSNSIVAYRAAETGQQNYQESPAPTGATTPPTNGTTTVPNTRPITNNTVTTWTWSGTTKAKKR